ncbi:MAG: hypothetical protein A49_13030 [Methyloceanibacter sp.]|nr:MAG: hypothetical protein A49_13030 [Methyloceanibacter sp.]
MLRLKIERLRGILGRGRILPKFEIGCRPIAIGRRGLGIELERVAEIPDGGMIALAFGMSPPSAVIRRGGGGQERGGFAEGLERRVVILQRGVGIAAVVVGAPYDGSRAMARSKSLMASSGCPRSISALPRLL